MTASEHDQPNPGTTDPLQAASDAAGGDPRTSPADRKHPADRPVTPRGTDEHPAPTDAPSEDNTDRRA